MGTIKNRKTVFHDLGIRSFEDTWELQTRHFEKIIAQKRSGDEFTENHLFFVEHPHVFTLGKNGSEENLLVPLNELDKIDASYFPINRGGDITYHGPGQIVVYPVLDLENFEPDLSIYLRSMEEAVIETLKSYGIESSRYEGLTGVWLEPDTERARKICAIGIKTSRWVSMHGLAFNINTNLDYFNYIVPCGIDDKGVTSLQKELGRHVDMDEVKKILLKNFEMIFGMEFLQESKAANQY